MLERSQESREVIEETRQELQYLPVGLFLLTCQCFSKSRLVYISFRITYRLGLNVQFGGPYLNQKPW